MNDSGDASCIDQTVQPLPVLPSHGSHDESRRGDGQCQEDKPRQKTYLNETALEYVVPYVGPDYLPFIENDACMTRMNSGKHGGKVVTRKEEDVRCQMERGIEEGA